MDTCNLRDVLVIISEHLDIELQDIRREATFEELGADNLDVIELVMAVEEEFGCEIPVIEEGDEVTTVGEFLDEIEPYL